MSKHKLAALVFAPMALMLGGCNTSTITNQDVDQYSNEHSAEKYKLVYKLLPNSAVNATLSISNIKTEINDNNVILKVRGVTKGKNQDYTVNTTFTVTIKGNVIFNSNSTKLFLTDPIVKLDDALEISKELKDSYMKTTQSALEDIVDYNFKTNAIYQYNKQEIDSFKKEFKNYSFVQVTTQKGLITLKLIK